MTTEEWSRVRSVIENVLDRPEAERNAFLAEACGGDEVLRREVSTLLEAHDRAEASNALSGPFLIRHEREADAAEGPRRA